MAKLSITSLRNATILLAIASDRMADKVRAASAGIFARARKLDARQIVLFALAAAVLATLTEPALAQAAGGGTAAGGTAAITTFLQNLVNLLTGTAGKLIAVLAICVVGIGALMGGLSLRAAGSVILGVMLIFSAAWIVDQIIA